jgi:membrane protein
MTSNGTPVNTFRESIIKIVESIGYILLVIRRAVQQFNNKRGPEVSASLAFYALLSLFPLLTFLVAVVSLIYEHYLSEQQVLDFIIRFFPISRDFISENVRRVLLLRGRGTISLVSMGALLWSSTGYFSILVENINRAWSNTRGRHYVHNRLLAVGIVISLVLIFIFSLLATMLFDLLPGFNIIVAGNVTNYKPLLWRLFSNTFPLLLRILVFWMLYQAAPNTRVMKIAAFWGALLTALAWELLTVGLTWFLSSGWAHYDLVYGSLGTIITLLLWIYLTGWIILVGAYLSAEIAQFMKIFTFFGYKLVEKNPSDLRKNIKS